MFHHRLDDQVEKRVFVKWYLLSFLAGSVNCGAILATGRFVTHVTGFATLSGIEFAQGNFDQALGFLFVPIFFLLGAVISAYLVDRPYHRGRPPHYDWVMLLVTICLVLVSVGGHLQILGGHFGGVPRMKEDFALLALLCLASGLQNAAITTSSGASVRTTHLTGLTTDLGIGIVRAMEMKAVHPKRQREIRANWLRMGTIISFTCGSALSALLYFSLHYLGFLLPAMISAYAFVQARIDHPKILAAGDKI